MDKISRASTFHFRTMIDPTIGWIVGIIAALAGAFTALARVYKWGPFVENEDMPSIDNISTIPDEPVVPASPPPVMAPTSPKLPDTGVLLWNTPKAAFHSTRVLCDETGLDLEQKNEICYTIWGESEFHIGAIGKPNKNGTRDYGICQFNDGTNAKGIPFWIGEGAAFKDVNEVLTNPEKCVRVMIQTYKAGHISWWYGHKGYSLTTVQNSPMWKLRVV